MNSFIYDLHLEWIGISLLVGTVLLYLVWA